MKICKSVLCPFITIISNFSLWKTDESRPRKLSVRVVWSADGSRNDFSRAENRRANALFEGCRSARGLRAGGGVRRGCRRRRRLHTVFEKRHLFRRIISESDARTFSYSLYKFRALPNEGAAREGRFGPRWRNKIPESGAQERGLHIKRRRKRNQPWILRSSLFWKIQHSVYTVDYLNFVIASFIFSRNETINFPFCRTRNGTRANPLGTIQFRGIVCLLFPVGFAPARTGDG